MRERRVGPSHLLPHLPPRLSRQMHLAEGNMRRVTMSQMECHRRIDVRYERMDVKSTNNAHQRSGTDTLLGAGG